MSSTKVWLVILALLVVIVAAIVVTAGFYFLLQRPTVVRAGTVVEVQLGGPALELPSENPLVQIFQPHTLNVWDLVQLFDYAARDDRVAAVYLEIQPLQWSWAQVEEVRDAILQFRESGKPVHCFSAADLMTEGTLYLASAADTITLNPEAAVTVKGLLIEVTFFKRMLEKLSIRPDFLQFKEYKSSEPYTRDDLSPLVREMLESILRDLQERWIVTVARDRDLSEQQLRGLLEISVLPADAALQAGLVDGLGYKDEIMEMLKSEAGTEPDYRGVKAANYLKGARPRFRPSSGHRVALVGGLGTITSGESDAFMEVLGGSTLASHLRAVREDSRFKGVIFRVNSPGGSAVGSDMVWREVRLLEENNKPVVVSMSGTAGSGGYYIAMGARRIVSQPSTITGSIGVILGKFNLRGFFDWLGISVDQVKLYPNADLFSAFSSFDDRQRQVVEAAMERLYNNFVEKAAEGRGLSFEELEPLARGRIYTGAQARELGLVDELGGLSTAVAEMKEALNLGEDEELELILYPRPKTLLELLTTDGLPSLRLRFQSAHERVQDELRRLLTSPPWLLMPEITVQ